MSLIDHDFQKVPPLRIDETPLWSVISENSSGRRGNYWRRMSMLCLRYICGWDYRMISNAFGCNIGTAWRTVDCAAREVRDMLSSEDDLLFSFGLSHLQDRPDDLAAPGDASTAA